MLSQLFLATILLSLTPPKADLKVIGPTQVPPGGVVLLDASQSVCDFPVAWVVTPPDSAALFRFDQNGKKGAVSCFAATTPGTYTVLVVAPSWSDDAHTQFSIDVAASRLTVGNPPPPPGPPPVPPPVPPTPPSDPLGQAAAGYRADLLASYAKNYADAAASIQARGPVSATLDTLKGKMASAGRAAFAARFAPWKAQFPAEGSEPATESQWQAIYSLMNALAGAFQ